MNVVLLISALLASSLGFALKGCSPGNRPGKELVEADSPAPATPAAVPLVNVDGRFTFEDVSATVDADGTVGPTVTRIAPVRFAQVINLDGDEANPKVISAAPVFTDADGRFVLPSPLGTPFRPTLVLSTVGSGRGVEVRAPGGQVRMVSVKDIATGQAFVLPAGTPSASITVNTIAATEPDRIAGALNILDTATTGVDSTVATIGTTLPTAVFLYDAAATDGSFFERFNDAVGGPAVTIKGGDAVNDETDEFDDAVILHELGHFVAFAISKNSSLGGEHFARDAGNPPLAWSEGFATFFASLVRADPVNLNSASVLGSPSGFALNIETRALSTFGGSGARGLRSELSVAEILWDLVDGIEGRANADAEGALVTAAQLMTSVRALRGTNAYVSLNDFLGALVSAGAISAADLNTVLDAPDDQSLDFPPGPADVFPTRVVQNGVPVLDVAETRVANGVGTDTEDAVSRFFLLDLAAAGTLTATLALAPPADGRNASGTNLDLIILDDQNQPALDAAGVPIAPRDQSQELNPERVPPAGASPRLAAGRYILLVSGRADFVGGARNASPQVVPFSLTVGP